MVCPLGWTDCRGQLHFRSLSLLSRMANSVWSQGVMNSSGSKPWGGGGGWGCYLPIFVVLYLQIE